MTEPRQASHRFRGSVAEGTPKSGVFCPVLSRQNEAMADSRKQTKPTNRDADRSRASTGDQAGKSDGPYEGDPVAPDTATAAAWATEEAEAAGVTPQAVMRSAPDGYGTGDGVEHGVTIDSREPSGPASRYQG